MSIVLHLTGEDLLRVRFAISPIWEIVNAARTLVDERSRRYHAPWAEAARAAVARRADLALLTALHPRVGYVPDFASPPPTTAAPTIESQLAELGATPLARVAEELERCRQSQRDPAAREVLAALRDDPDRARSAIAAAISGVWADVMAPLWPPVEALLQRELTRRSRTLAEHGLQRAVEAIDPRVRWRAGAIVIESGLGDDERRLRGEGLVLMPSAFIWPSVTAIVDEPWQPTIAYPAQGIGLLWEPAPEPPGALERLLGRTRALVLAGLDRPLSTTALAHRHALSPSGVSAHLAALRDAGLATTERHGHEVRYRRTALGDRLLRGS